MKLIYPLLAILAISCGENQPRVVYSESDSTATETELRQDTTAVPIADLPVHFDSTRYLIHPIGVYIPRREGGRKIYGSYSKGESSMSVSYSNYDEISGNMDNLKFQHLNSDELVPLTDRRLKIREVTFLRPIYKVSKKQYLLYSITDKDTNKDRALSNIDIESLYLSKADGSNFRKLSPDMQELREWEIIDVLQRIYFVTIEDIDKNGEFDLSDQMHYFYVDLSLETPSIVEYKPLTSNQ